MDRRSFIKTASSGTLGLFAPELLFPPGKTHLITLSFDDGFRKSFYRIADIFEDFGLKACLNVIASGHLPTFKAPDKWILPELLGNFDDWNALQERGHELMPHSWEHLNLTRIPYRDATTRIDKCLTFFEHHLNGFKTSEAVYNFAFNASTPELEQYVLSKVRALRSGGDSAVNEIPKSHHPTRLGCKSMGPDNIDGWIESQIDRFLQTSGGWLILNTHGLDGEGWGPVSSDYLTRLLKRLVKIGSVSVLPTGEVFNLISR